MEAKKKQLTLDIDPAFQRRLKVMAALKGVSMRGYCQAAIDQELTRDEANGLPRPSSSGSYADKFEEHRRKNYGGKVSPRSGVDDIRAGREERDAETANWAEGADKSLDDRPAHVRFAELRQEIFGGKPLPGDSADYIREGREERNAQMDNWR